MREGEDGGGRRGGDPPELNLASAITTKLAWSQILSCMTGKTSIIYDLIWS